MPQRSDRSVISYLAFLGILLAFGIDAALPAFDEIEASFGLTESGQNISLLGTLYFLGMAVGQVVYGPLADRFGRAPIMRLGLVLYALGALGAALAPTFNLLLAARLVWGFGGASPAVLRGAIARDLYEGDQMARVVTLMMAVFLIGPILVPFIGSGILTVASWHWVFAASLMLAAGAIAWTFRFGETLDPANRRSLSLRPLAAASREVLGNRITMGYIAVQTLAGGAFFVYLGSSPQIIDTIYGRGDEFPLWFATSGITMVGALLVNNRLIGRYGARRMLLIATGILFATSVVGLVITLAADGRPQFFTWLIWVCTVNAMTTLISPMANALALEPMGELAGTASAILGFVSLAGGALLAAVIDARLELTVTPMLWGHTVLGGLALGAALLAGPAYAAERRLGSG